MADTPEANAAYEEWKKKNPLLAGIRTRAEWEAWTYQKANPNPSSVPYSNKISGAPGSGNYNQDRTDEQFAGDFANMTPEEKAFETQARVAGKRQRIADSGAAMPLPPDVADLVMRDLASGRVRRARGGSTRSAIMGPDLTSPGYKAPPARPSALASGSFYGERKP